jgi:hypothetical protein
MAGIAVTTRLSRSAVALLQARAARAGLGTSAYASRLLESALLGREAVAIGGESLPRGTQEALAAQIVFIAVGIEKAFAKRPAVVEEIRLEAKKRAKGLLARDSNEARPQVSVLPPASGNKAR